MSEIAYDEGTAYDEGMEAPAGPPMSEQQWNDMQASIAYLTSAELGRQQEADEQYAAVYEAGQESELADLIEYDPPAAVEALREQMAAEFEAQLEPIREGLAGWQEERALNAVAQEVDELLDGLSVPAGERQAAYETANEILAAGIAEAAANYGLSEPEFWALAEQNAGLGEALALFGRNSLQAAARQLEMAKETQGKDELYLARTFARRHGLV